MDAGCRVECCFCRLELLEACLYCMALEPYSWILPCGVLEDTGNSCWKMPCMHGMSLVVVVFLVEELILYVELLGVAGLRVETL